MRIMMPLMVMRMKMKSCMGIILVIVLMTMVLMIVMLIEEESPEHEVYIHDSDISDSKYSAEQARYSIEKDDIIVGMEAGSCRAVCGGGKETTVGKFVVRVDSED